MRHIDATLLPGARRAGGDAELIARLAEEAFDDSRCRFPAPPIGADSRASFSVYTRADDVLPSRAYRSRGLGSPTAISPPRRRRPMGTPRRSLVDGDCGGAVAGAGMISMLAADACGC